MKYEELDYKLKLLAFKARKDKKNIFIYKLLGELMAVIYDDGQGGVYFLDSCADLKPDRRMKFYDLVLGYAKASVREKKYNVVSCHHKYGTPDNMTEYTYFYYRNDEGCLLATDEKTNDNENQQWTISQIKEYGLEDCERIEVE